MHLPPLDPIQAPLARPVGLVNGEDPDVAMLLAVLDEAVAARVTVQEAREGYMTALLQVASGGWCIFWGWVQGAWAFV